MKALDSGTLKRFLDEVADRLEGEWVIIGGASLPLLGAGFRPTADIDVAGPEDASMAQSLLLMEIAEELELPVEAINQAGTFFLRRIQGWREHVVTVRRGPAATILRPDATLFVLLKLQRLTETDLADCLEVLSVTGRNGERLDFPRLKQAVDAHLREQPSPGRLQRLTRLQEALSAKDAESPPPR